MDLKIEISQAELTGLAEHRPPPLNQVAILHGQEPSSRDVQVIMRQQALRQVEAHSMSDVGTELGGVLLGVAYQHNQTVYVDVYAALPARSDEHGPVHFTFTADAWAQLHIEREQLYPDLHIVGWFHTHPNLGVFYSADDVVVHTTAFRMAYQVGLVVDPVRREACFFGWRDTRTESGEVEPIGGYFELKDEQHEPVVDWRNAYRTGLADMEYAAYSGGFERVLADDMPVYITPNFAVTRQALALSMMTFFAAVLMMLAFWIPTSQRSNNLETAVAILAEDRRTDLHTSEAIICPDPLSNLILPVSGQQVYAGQSVEFFGTAARPEAVTYVMEVRRVDPNDAFALEPSPWVRVDSLSLRWSSGRYIDHLGSWDTRGFEPSFYDVRLVAMWSSRNISERPIQGAACQLHMEILPIPTPNQPTVFEQPTLAPTAAPAAPES